MTTMNISLPDALRDYVDERVAGGGFANVSEYVRALIREDRARQAKTLVETRLLEGLASGPPVETSDAYWNGIKAAIRASRRKSAR
jgi:antitoxin ParD1/3/4